MGTAAQRSAHAILLGGLAVLAWQSVVYSMAVTGRRADPAQAVRLAPGNALALTALAGDRVAADPGAAAALAGRALQRDPTSAAAASVLGLALAQQGDAARAEALMRYSQQMSRRDLPTQMFAIETAVQRGDINGALHHYDVALRVGRTTPTVLFPVLAEASADPAVRRSLTRLLVSGAPWKDSFLDYLAARSTKVVSAAALLGDIRAAGNAIPPGPLAIVVQRLVEMGEVTQARSLYGQAGSDMTDATVRNGRFTRTVEQPTVFDWQTIDTGDAHSEILAAPGGGEMRVEARSGAGGTVARQRLVLSSGNWTLAFDASPDEGGTLGTSTIDVVCVPGANRIGRVELAGAAGRPRQELRFSIPAGCTSQSLDVALDPGGSEAPLAGALRNLTLIRTPGATALQ
ncbi:hypothetical protein ACT009_14595 [Sphingomonas sp. Tas61C01]|uniref:hypothetical protein n=1 Tax=Sphingomonas sp. Tas61C01 TaxID=3458297 RepID=UPI00403E8B65